MSFFKKLFGGGDDSTKWLQAILMRQQQLAHEEQSRIAEEQRQQLRADEERRQANIRAGVSAIEQAFSQFNPAYFDQAKNDYLGFYLPQLDDQYKQSHSKLTAGLAEKGMLSSSTGANALAALSKRAADTRAQIGAEASDWIGQLQGKVQQQKGDLLSLANSAADPNAVAAQATGSATTLAAMPGGTTRQPLGNVFSDILQPFAVYTAARMNALPSGYRAPSSNNGSGSVNLFG
jgi:hypothetical protein